MMKWVTFSRDDMGRVSLQRLGDNLPNLPCDCPPFPEFPWLTCLAAGLGLATGLTIMAVMDKKYR